VPAPCGRVRLPQLYLLLLIRVLASGLGGHLPSLVCAALATLLRLGQMARPQFV